MRWVSMKLGQASTAKHARCSGSYWGNAHPAIMREALEPYVPATTVLEVARLRPPRLKPPRDPMAGPQRHPTPRTVQETVEYSSARYERLRAAHDARQPILRDGIEYTVDTVDTHRIEGWDPGGVYVIAEFTLREFFRVQFQLPEQL